MKHYFTFFSSTFFFFLFIFLLLFVLSSPLFLMLSGGDVRPLALVVIGRGQITTPYILVIPSEGDYCFLGRKFFFPVLCHITTINTTQTLFHFWLSPSLLCFLLELGLGILLSHLFALVNIPSSPSSSYLSHGIFQHVCSASNVADCA